MLKNVVYYKFIVDSKRTYAKKERLETDSFNGDREMEELAEDERNVESEPWKITGKNGCAAAVKALRVCFKDLLEQFADYHFTGKLMQVVAAIYRFERISGGKTRSIFFSREKGFLRAQIEFTKKITKLYQLYHRLNFEHSELRNEVKISVKGLYINHFKIPGGVSHFRIVSHMCIISDYFYVAKKKRFEPISMYNTMSVCGYSDYLPVYSLSDVEVVVRFPDGVFPSENDTVIHCLGLEFFGLEGRSYYFYNTGSGVMVCDVF